MPETSRTLVSSLLLLSLLAAAPAGACLYRPSADLWNLVEGADRIVIAEVVSVKPKAFNHLLIRLNTAEEADVELVHHFSPDSAGLLQGALEWSPSRFTPVFVAELRVIETLRGSSAAKILVEHDGWGPPVVPGETVVAFLDGGRFVGYGNGALYPRTASRLLNLRSMILAADDLQDRGAAAARIDWLLAAAGLPGSREMVLPVLGVAPLFDEHKRSLAEGFKRFPAFGGLRQTLEILAGFPDPDFDRLAAALASAILSEPEFSHVIDSETLELLLDRLGEGEQPRARGPNCTKSDLRCLFKEAVAKLDLPVDHGAVSEVRSSEAWRQRFWGKLRDTYG